MPTFIDAMQSRELNASVRSAAMNKFGTIAPTVARRPTVLEASSSRTKLLASGQCVLFA